jgi:predicted transposase YdaD
VHEVVAVDRGGKAGRKEGREEGRKEGTIHNTHNKLKK